MAINGIIIKNTGSAATINSGNPVWLNNITSFGRSLKPLTQFTPNNSSALVEGNQGGFENTVFTVQGYIDNENTSGTYVVNTSTSCSKLTPSLLNQMVKLTQSTNSQLWMRAFWGGTEVIDFNGLTGGFNVAFEGAVDMNMKADSASKTNPVANPFWDISFTLREVKPQ